MKGGGFITGFFLRGRQKRSLDRKKFRESWVGGNSKKV